MKSIIKTLFPIVLTLALTVTAQAKTIHLSVASSMTDVFKEIIATYSISHPKTKILANFGSSGSFAKQIYQGAPTDLYVSANKKWVKFLVDNKAITRANTCVIAYNQLVFIGNSGITTSHMDQLTSLQKIGIGTPQNVPAGQYAKQAMIATGVYSSLKEQGKLVMAKDVRQALLYADRGEVSGSFVYKTDALLASNAKIHFVVPKELHDPVSYHLALTVTGEKKEAAVDFFNYLSSNQASKIIEKHGFESASSKRLITKNGVS